MLAILFYILLVLSVWILSRYVVFFVATFRSGHLPWIRRQCGGLLYPTFRSFVTAMWAEMMLIPLFIAHLFRKKGVRESGPPVVMVHGLYHNASAWVIMKRRLAKAGFFNLHTYQYNSFTKDFTNAATGLSAKLDELVAEYPHEKIILIGHSLGGMVCRRVAGYGRYRHRIGGLVTLGTPHHGATLARFGGNRMARELIPGRAIPQAVEDMPDPDCPRLAIYSLIDDFVFPLPMLQPARDGWREQVCSPMGHVWMLCSREVAEMVVGFLRGNVR
ncbi:alpha/beta fold hydrolase [uncultured Pseudodesulfovibrio sp.]|uniref:esterase/lipase family protein n=1 Tax=uncultured Pseudodesulfovibrio sp. TaxID=2035858 RepID=UPI0029C76DC9|nr:alpha/beta fold hydrolase [uncultured Pseudodesulfovibrio sp.]